MVRGGEGRGGEGWVSGRIFCFITLLISLYVLGRIIGLKQFNFQKH